MSSAVLCSLLLSSAQLSAQQPDPVLAPVPEQPAARDGDARDAQIDALSARLEEMQRVLDAQQRELAAQKQALEAQAAAAGEMDALAALEQDPAGTALEEDFLHIYGFADVGLQRTWGPLYELVPGASNKTTFVLGNVNVYFDSKPLPDWRFLTEVRFGLFPHGGTPRGTGPGGGSTVGSLKSVNDRVSDDGSANGGFTDLVWNGVVLERAHIDWLAHDAFSLRAGWFLTPYGIWNVDHGSPTRIMIEPPTFITIELFPQRQLGLEAFGLLPAASWTFGYHAYVSNGRQPGQIDFGDDKALGFRLSAETRVPTPLTFGVSGYTGRYEDVEKSFALSPEGISAETKELVVFRDYAASGDVSVDIGDLRLRSEGVMRWKLFEDGKRSVDVPGTTNADKLTFGAYIMAAYRLPWLGLEPVAMAELMGEQSPVGDYVHRIGGGLNIYLSTVTTLRTSYVHTQLFDLDGPERNLDHSETHSLAARLIMAF